MKKKTYRIFRVYLDETKESEFVRIIKGKRRMTEMLKCMNYDEWNDQKYFYISKEVVS